MNSGCREQGCGEGGINDSKQGGQFTYRLAIKWINIGRATYALLCDCDVLRLCDEVIGHVGTFLFVLYCWCNGCSRSSLAQPSQPCVKHVLASLNALRVKCPVSRSPELRLKAARYLLLLIRALQLEESNGYLDHLNSRLCVSALPIPLYTGIDLHYNHSVCALSSECILPLARDVHGVCKRREEASEGVTDGG